MVLHLIKLNPLRKDALCQVWLQMSTDCYLTENEETEFLWAKKDPYIGDLFSQAYIFRCARENIRVVKMNSCKFNTIFSKLSGMSGG